MSRQLQLHFLGPQPTSSNKMDRSSSSLRLGVHRRMDTTPTQAPTSISPGGIAAAVIFTLVGVGGIVFLIILCVYQKEYQKDQERKRTAAQQRKLEIRQQLEAEQQELKRRHLEEQKMHEAKESQESSALTIMAMRIQELETLHYGQSPPPPSSKIAVSGQFNRPRQILSSPTIDAFYAPNDTFDGDKTIGIRNSRPADQPSVPSVSLPSIRKSNVHGSPSEKSNPNGSVYSGGGSRESSTNRDMGYDTRYHPSMDVTSSYHTQPSYRTTQTPAGVTLPSHLTTSPGYSNNYHIYPSPTYLPEGKNLSPAELARQQRHRHYQTGNSQVESVVSSTLIDNHTNNHHNHQTGDVNAYSHNNSNNNNNHLAPLLPPSAPQPMYLPPPYSPPPSPPSTTVASTEPPATTVMNPTSMNNHHERHLHTDNNNNNHSNKSNSNHNNNYDPPNYIVNSRNDSIPGVDINMFPDNIPPMIVMPPTPAPVSASMSVSVRGADESVKNHHNDMTNITRNSSSSSGNNNVQQPQQHAVTEGSVVTSSSSLSSQPPLPPPPLPPQQMTPTPPIPPTPPVSGSSSMSAANEQPSVAARVAALKAHNEAIKQQKLKEQVTMSLSMMMV